uniref:Elongin-A-like n=1 Tax=Pogona vitticeps TaxID=103695 RepID=A0ABM5GFW1_9SAUR
MLGSKEVKPSRRSSNISSSSDKRNQVQGSEHEQRSKDCGSFCGRESKARCKDTRQGIDHKEKTSEENGFSIAMKKGSKWAPGSREDFLTLEGGKSGKEPSTKQVGTEVKGLLKPSSKCKSPVKPRSRNVSGPPAMSFESYLNYDQPLCRRKRKSSDRQPVKGNRSTASRKSSTTTPEEGERKQLKLDDHWEAPRKKAKTSLQDLLNTPLPKALPELWISSPPYAAEFKAPPVTETPRPKGESVQFLGQRRNSKVQMNSGSKTIYLSKMLTLYEQCIRVLQNNIDLLHEVGGVPFEMLEPVLTRCTPEQLLRIEDCNPKFVDESDLLWKIHCQKYFRNEQPLEYESWREMYLRLFNQREEKLKSLTKNILSAQSDKSKGRQVKMAFVHGMAKSPRSLRGQQDIYGTSGPLIQLQSKSKNSENKERSETSSDSNKCIKVASARSCIFRSGPGQHVKKPPKKIAPIMRKSLRAFKNRVGPR